MGVYRIEYGRQASSILRKIPKNVRLRIVEKINALAASPLQAANVKKLSGDEGVYRLRVGDWRIIYLVEDEKLLIYIQKIGARGGVYK